MLLSSSQCLLNTHLRVQDVDSAWAALIATCLRHPTGTLLLRLYSSSTLLSHLLLVPYTVPFCTIQYHSVIGRPTVHMCARRTWCWQAHRHYVCVFVRTCSINNFQCVFIRNKQCLYYNMVKYTIIMQQYVPTPHTVIVL